MKRISSLVIIMILLTLGACNLQIPGYNAPIPTVSITESPAVTFTATINTVDPTLVPIFADTVQAAEPEPTPTVFPTETLAPTPTLQPWVIQEVYSPDLILDTNESAALEPTNPPPSNEKQEPEVIGSVQIEGQEGEFDLIDPKLGQEVAAYDNLDQLGYAETGDGRWVIFDNGTRLAIETVKRTDLERWKRLPGFDIREGFIKKDKLFRTYYPSGFFVNYREEDVPYDPTDANSEKVRVGVIKLFVPKGNTGGTFIDAIVLDNMYYIDEGFEDSALLPQGPEFETASGILNEVEIGSYLRLQIAHGGDLLDNYPRPDNPDVWARSFIKFVEGYRNINPDAYTLYHQGNENLLVGPAAAINFWTEADQ